MQMGLLPGERVALFMRNHPAVVELMFACWWAGLVVVPVNAKLHAKELAFVLGHSGARLCVATPDTVEDAAWAAREAAMGARVIDVADRTYETLITDAVPLPMTDTLADDVAWLFYTSGTTGRPKGAMLTHRNLMTMTLAYFADVDSIAHTDAMLHAAPMSHGSGMYILPHVAAGAAQVVPSADRFDPGTIFDLVRHHPGMMIFAAPTMVKRLVEHPGAARADLANLKTIVYGGGPMYLADIRRALTVMGNRFVQIYGQGETPMTVTALARHHHADTGHARYLERLASVGTPYAAVEVRVADAEDRALPVGETGEVLVRGDTVMRGYWNDPTASASALKGGWLHTGDVGAFDADGFLTLKDRSKDLIISGGSNIYPREVEECLLAHASVGEVSVVGRPHAEWGEEVVAFVVTAEGKRLDPATLDAHCADRIARYKRPKLYLAVDTLPKNNYGKVLKTELRKRLAGEKAVR
jgi:long-chain acyl-CoA synthetase